MMYMHVRMLLENPSRYLDFEGGTWHEADFLSEIVRRTGCGLLLDVNNVHVSCVNLALDAHDYLARLPLHAVGEVHLAGHAVESFEDGATLLVDDHGAPVAADVWSLYAHALDACGPRLRPIVGRICIAGDSLQLAETGLGLRRRQGKTLLKQGLQALAEHYGIG